MATIGVKIELEGAQAYKKGMSEATNQTKLYQAEVKKLENDLKNGNGSFSKRIELSNALKNQLKAQREQESLLKAEIERVSQAQGEDSAQVIKLKTQYENLQTAIAKTENSLKEYGGQFGAIGAQFEEFGSKMGAIGSKMQSFGESLTKNVTLPLIGVAGASMSAFNEVDGALDTVIKKTGATGEALKEMESITKDIATSIPVSFDAVGNAVGEVNTRFGSTGEELKSLSTAFLEFSELNGTDVVGSIDEVQKALSAYGEGAENAIPYLDRLNLVGQQTGVNVSKLSQGIISNATAFQELGLSLDEATVFMGQLEKSGANSETVLNGMRKALKNATKDGKSLDVALSELQNSIENGEGAIDGLTVAYDVFGKSGDQIYGAIKNGTINFNELVASMDSASGSVADTFNATLDPIDNFQTNMNKLKVLGTDIANSLMPTITKAMEKFSELITKLSDKWNGLSEEQQAFIIKVAEIAVVVGPILALLGKFVATIGSISSGIGLLITNIPIIAGAVSAFGATITATVIPAVTGFLTLLAPFIPLIAGITAGVIAVIEVIQHWSEITEFFGEIWEKVSTRFSEVWENIKAKVEEGTQKVKDTVLSLGDRIKESFNNLKEQALTWGRDLIQNFINGIMEKVEYLKQTVANVAQTVADYLHFSEPKKGALSDFNESGGDMMKNFAEGIENAKYLVEQAVAQVALDVNTMLSDPLDYDRIYDAVKEGASSATTKIILNNREVTRALGGMGVVFNG